MLMLTLLLFVIISAASSARAPSVSLSGITIIFDSDRGDICVCIDERLVIDLLGMICVRFDQLVECVCVCVMNSCLQKLKQLNNTHTHTHCIAQSNSIKPRYCKSNVTFEVVPLCMFMEMITLIIPCFWT